MTARDMVCIQMESINDVPLARKAQFFDQFLVEWELVDSTPQDPGPGIGGRLDLQGTGRKSIRWMADILSQ